MNLAQPVFGLNLDPVDAILSRGEDAVLAAALASVLPGRRAAKAAPPEALAEV